MSQTRPLNTSTLDQAARDMAGAFLQPSRFSKNSPDVAIWGRDWVMQSLYNADFMDEFDYLVPRIKAQLGPDAVKEFDILAAARFTKRNKTDFEEILARKLARKPNGEVIKGAVGTTIIGELVTGYAPKVIETRHGPITLMKPIKQPVYAGQEALLGGINAQNMNISAEIAILALDAMLDGLDEGTGAAIIQGRTGVQPADPDAVTTGTLLFTLPMTDPAFAGATDQANGTVRASASAITDDSSADATGTLGYCRVSASNDGATALDDHIDGEAGTSGADFNFNTLSIVAGAVISMSSYTVTLDQGTTAT